MEPFYLLYVHFSTMNKKVKHSLKSFRQNEQATIVGGHAGPPGRRPTNVPVLAKASLCEGGGAAKPRRRERQGSAGVIGQALAPSGALSLSRLRRQLPPRGSLWRSPQVRVGSHLCVRPPVLLERTVFAKAFPLRGRCPEGADEVGAGGKHQPSRGRCPHRPGAQTRQVSTSSVSASPSQLPLKGKPLANAATYQVCDHLGRRARHP